jgi:hypothetical protein
MVTIEGWRIRGRKPHQRDAERRTGSPVLPPRACGGLFAYEHEKYLYSAADGPSSTELSAGEVDGDRYVGGHPGAHFSADLDCRIQRGKTDDKGDFYDGSDETLRGSDLGLGLQRSTPGSVYDVDVDHDETLREPPMARLDLDGHGRWLGTPGKNGYSREHIQNNDYPDEARTCKSWTSSVASEATISPWDSVSWQGVPQPPRRMTRYQFRFSRFDDYYGEAESGLVGGLGRGG